MNEQRRHADAPDRRFGQRPSNDQAVIDVMLAYARAHHSDLPVTCAVALEAAETVRERHGG
jgi:hypothetical protein